MTSLFAKWFLFIVIAVSEVLYSRISENCAYFRVPHTGRSVLLASVQKFPLPLAQQTEQYNKEIRSAFKRRREWVVFVVAHAVLHRIILNIDFPHWCKPTFPFIRNCTYCVYTEWIPAEWSGTKRDTRMLSPIQLEVYMYIGGAFYDRETKEMSVFLYKLRFVTNPYGFMVAANFFLYTTNVLIHASHWIRYW